MTRLFRALRTLLGSVVTIEPPDLGPDPNPAVERVEHYRIRDSERIALQDSEEPMAWIESSVYFPIAAVDGHAEFDAVPDGATRPPRTKRPGADR